jgi:hypothetical protein
MAKEPTIRDNAGGKSARATGGGAVPVDSGGSMLGMAASVFILVVASVASLIGKLWDGITGDKALARAGRIGREEFASALKAFPDSIQGYDPGPVDATEGASVYGRGKPSSNGSYGPTRHPWPSEVARQQRNQPRTGHNPDREHGQGHDGGHSM